MCPTAVHSFYKISTTTRYCFAQHFFTLRGKLLYFSLMIEVSKLSLLFRNSFYMPSLLLLACVCLLIHVRIFCNPLDCSPPGFSAHGIFQARILEWLPLPAPRDLPNPGSNLHLLFLLHWQENSCRFLLYH